MPPDGGGYDRPQIIDGALSSEAHGARTLQNTFKDEPRLNQGDEPSNRGFMGEMAKS